MRYMLLYSLSLESSCWPIISINKEKELIALAIGITVKCDGCIVHHTKGCIDAGCTIEEISEMMEVCVAMGGGPATVYAGKSLRIAEELLK